MISLEGLAASAREAMERDDPQAALEALDQAVALDPDCELRFMRGDVLIALGRHEEAIPDLSVAVESYADVAHAWRSLGRAQLETEQFGPAAESYGQAVELDGNHAPTWFNLGTARLGLDQLDVAADAFGRAADLDQESTVVQVRLAQVLVALGRHREALEGLDRACQRHAKLASEPRISMMRAAALTRVHPGDALAALDAARGSWPEAIAGWWVLRAEAFNNSGRPQDALGALDHAEAELTDDLRGGWWLQRAIALAVLGRHDEADGALDQAEAALPPSVEGTLVGLRTAILVARGSHQEAVRVSEEAEARLPESQLGSTLLHKSDALSQLGRHDEARAALAAAERQGHGSEALQPELRLMSASLLLRRGDSQSALDALDPADPNPAVQIARARGLLSLHQAAEAEKAVQAAIDADPGLGAPWLMRARIRQAAGDLEAALGSLDRAFALDPGLERQPLILSQRAGFRLRLGDVDGYLDDLDRLEEIEPKARLFLDALRAGALTSVGRYGQAGAALERAAGASGGDDLGAFGWLGVGLARISLDRPPGEVAQALERVLEAAPATADTLPVLMARALSLLGLGRFGEALETVGELERAGGNELLVAELRAMALAPFAERADEALAALDQLIRLAREERVFGVTVQVAAWVQMGWIHNRDGDLQQAAEDFDAAVAVAAELPEEDSNRINAVLGQALVALRRGRVDAAIELTSHAADAAARLSFNHPVKGVAWWAMGLALAAGDRHDEALLAFRRAVEGGGRPEPWIAMGESHLELGDADRALAAFRTALERARTDDDRFAAYVGTGHARQGRGEYEGAVDAYREALAISPERVRGWVSLGEAYNALGRHGAAERAFRRAWDLQGRGARSSLVPLGTSASLLSQDRYREALELLDGPEVAPLAAKDRRLSFNRGVALYQLGRHGEARAAWTEAAEGPHAVARARGLADELRPPQGGDTSWVEFWFGATGGATRRLVGAGLLALLVVVLLASLVDPSRVGWLSWLSDREGWEAALAPALVLAVLLALPSVASLSIGSVKIQPRPEVPEPSGDLDQGIDAALRAVMASVRSATRPEVPVPTGDLDQRVEVSVRGVMLPPTNLGV